MSNKIVRKRNPDKRFHAYRDINPGDDRILSAEGGLARYYLKKGIPIGLFTLSGYKSWR